MLLNQLKKVEEKQSFASLAYLVAKADGSISLEDMAMFDLFGGEMDLPKNRDLAPIQSIDELCSAFTEPLAKEIVFTNLLSLTLADKFEDKAQQQMLGRIGDSLGISRTSANSSRSWMKIVQGTHFPSYFD